MRTELVTPPASEAITVAEAATNVFGDATYDATKLTRNIKTARIAAELYCERAFINQTWKATFEGFPTVNKYNRLAAIYLPKGKIQSITSIQYVDQDEAMQTLTEGTHFELENTGIPGRVVLKEGQSWPSTSSNTYEAVTVTFVAGEGSSLDSSKFDDVRDAMMAMIGDLYEVRQNLTPQQVYNNNMYANILAPHKIYFDFDLYNG